MFPTSYRPKRIFPGWFRYIVVLLKKLKNNSGIFDVYQPQLKPDTWTDFGQIRLPVPGSLPEAQLRIFTSGQNQSTREVGVEVNRRQKCPNYFFKKYHNISESSRKNAFGPIGRREHAKLARELFLLTKNSGLCAHLSLGARLRALAFPGAAREWR